MTSAWKARSSSSLFNRSASSATASGNGSRSRFTSGSSGSACNGASASAGGEPSTAEVKQLQKLLINKTEEVVEKALAIKEKERMYLELKNILARQPGPEAAEQLSVYRSSLKEKTRQMKAMASELNMLHAQGNEYKYEIERLVRELNDMKRKYFETRRREQLDRTGRSQGATGKGGALQQPPMSMSVPAPDNERSRFMGGGFSLAQLPG